MAETVQQLLRERADDDRVGLKYGDRTWTWREHLAEAAAEASVLIASHDPDRPLHVGTLLGNTPEMLRAMAAAGLGGYVLCGINTTRRGEGLLADVRRADCQFLLTDEEHLPLLEGLDLAGVTVIDVTAPDWAARLAKAGPLTPYREVGAMDTLMMIFTSGTSGEPKAVQVAHLMVLFSGLNLVERFSVTADDVCYIAMPLFHSNAVVAGWAVALGVGRGDGAGAVLGLAVPRGRAALRRDVHELRRQAARLHPGDARAPRRRRQPAAGGVRQRGERPRHRGVRAALRLPR